MSPRGLRCLPAKKRCEMPIRTNYRLNAERAGLKLLLDEKNCENFIEFKYLSHTEHGVDAVAKTRKHSFRSITSKMTELFIGR